MSGRRRVDKPRLSDLCRSANVQIQDLADACGKSKKMLEKLESSSAPVKDNVWEIDWHRRIMTWLPILGHAFQDVPHCLAFEKCPAHEREWLAAEYKSWASQPQPTPDQPSHEEIEARRAKFHKAVYEHNNRRDWVGGARIAAQAARLYPKYDSNWLFYRALETSCVQYGGQPELADSKISQYLGDYDWTIAQSGRSPDVRSRTYAELVRVWSDFGRGNWQQAFDGFDRTAKVGQAIEDDELKNTGIHMRARAYFEPWVLKAIYAPPSTRFTSPTQYIQNLNDLETAQSVVRRDSVEAGFGNWYIGIVTGLLADHTQGKSLIRRSEGILLEHKIGIGAKRRCGVALLQAEIYGNTWDGRRLQQIESSLEDLLMGCSEDVSPDTDANIALTLAHARLLRDPNTSNLVELKITLKHILFALLLRPYPEHEFWRIGLQMIQRHIKPNLSLSARQDILQVLADYCSREVWPFAPLPRNLPPHRLIVSTVKVLREELATE